MNRLAVIISTMIFLIAAPASANSIPADLQREMDSISATIATGGSGWSGYAEFLHPNYSRWAIGELYQQRADFIGALKEWWDYGMRVSSRTVEIVGADITRDVAIIRMKTTETFIGPDGDSGGFEGYVVNVWTNDKGEWKLLSADITPAK